MKPLAVLLLLAAVPCFAAAQDNDDQGESPTEYLLAEEYATPAAGKLNLLRSSGITRYRLSVADRKSRPAFDVDIDLNKSWGGYYKIGEQITFTFSPRRDCYLLIYDVQPDGLINILFPNSAGDPSGFVKAGRTYTIPSGDQPHLQVLRPTGREYIQVVAAAAPLDLTNLHLSLVQNDLLRFEVSGDSFLFVNALRGKLSQRETNQWTAKSLFFFVSETLSDPTDEELETYRSTGSTGTRDVIAVDRWNFRDYKIIWGDTLWGICEREYENGRLFPKLAMLNGIRNPDRIYAGDDLKIYSKEELLR